MQTRIFLPLMTLSVLTGCTFRPPEPTLSNVFPTTLKEMNLKIDQMADVSADKAPVSLQEKLVLYHCLHMQVKAYQTRLTDAIIKDTSLLDQPAPQVLHIQPTRQLPVSPEEVQKRLGVTEEQITRICQLYHDSLQIIDEEISYLSVREAGSYLSEQERHFSQFAHKLICAHAHITGKSFNPVYLRHRYQHSKE